MPSSNRWLPPLDEQHTAAYSAPDDPPPSRGVGSAAGEKVTVTRAAAARSREMGSRMYGFVHRAATADGADKSGLTALTWPVVANFAVDAAMAVALANTLFFAAASGESKGKVALYLLITIAPFAVIAPLIGPALDRLQHGRRDRVVRPERLQHDDWLVESLGAVELELHPVEVLAVQRRGHQHHLGLDYLAAQLVALRLLAAGWAVVQHAGVPVEEIVHALEVLEDPLVVVVVDPDVAHEDPDRVLLRYAAHGTSDSGPDPPTLSLV